mmetsp:Transcript_11238/g.14653  ORF Transcript_11238/g.14653 Transcript_11238/m.14653 type:complete len:712 (-) Transcript_11238:73-2208(-)
MKGSASIKVEVAQSGCVEGVQETMAKTKAEKVSKKEMSQGDDLKNKILTKSKGNIVKGPPKKLLPRTKGTGSMKELPPPFFIPPPMPGFKPSELNIDGKQVLTKQLEALTKFHLRNFPKVKPSSELAKSNTQAQIKSTGFANPMYKVSSAENGKQGLGRAIAAEIKTSISEMPPIDPKMSKRQRRLIRNRMSAQLHREKKKKHMGQLKERVKTLESENEELGCENKKLKEKLDALNRENRKFYEEIQRLLEERKAEISFSLQSSSCSKQAIVGGDHVFSTPVNTEHSPYDFIDTPIEQNLQSSFCADATSNEIFDVDVFSDEAFPCSDDASEEMLSSASPSASSFSSDTDDSSLIGNIALDDIQPGTKKRKRLGNSARSGSRYKNIAAAGFLASFVFVISFLGAGMVGSRTLSSNVINNRRNLDSTFVLSNEFNSTVNDSIADEGVGYTVVTDVLSVDDAKSKAKGEIMQLALVNSKTRIQKSSDKQRFIDILWDEISILTKLLAQDNIVRPERIERERTFQQPARDNDQHDSDSGKSLAIYKEKTLNLEESILGEESGLKHVHSSTSESKAHIDAIQAAVAAYINHLGGRADFGFQESFVMCPSAYGMLWDGLRNTSAPGETIRNRTKQEMALKRTRKNMNSSMNSRHRSHSKYKNETKVEVDTELLPHLTLLVPSSSVLPREISGQQESDPSFVQIGCRVDTVTELFGN